jgi:hypothetical protein
MRVARANAVAGTAGDKRGALSRKPVSGTPGLAFLPAVGRDACVSPAWQTVSTRRFRAVTDALRVGYAKSAATLAAPR